MKSILIKGYFGHENIGDDIFCIVSQWMIILYLPNYFPIYIGKNLPKLIGKGIKVTYSNNLFKKIKEIFYILKADKIIYFGGSVFQKRFSLLDLRFYEFLINTIRKKIIVFGTSIGPFKTQQDRRYFEKTFRKVLSISVRDIESKDRMNNIGKNVSFSFDPAIMISDVYPDLLKSHKMNGKIKLGLSLTQYENRDSNINSSLNFEPRIYMIENIISRLISEGKLESINIYIFNNNKNQGDIKLSEYFYKKFKEFVNCNLIPYSNDTYNTLKSFSNNDFIIGVRLHSAILAYSLNIPFILAEYHNKCTAFLNCINHNYRFIEGSFSETYSNISTILTKNCIPNIINPNNFKILFIKTFRKELKVTREL